MPIWLIAALVVFVAFIVFQKLRRGGKFKPSRSGIHETRHVEPMSGGAVDRVDGDMDDRLRRTFEQHGKISAVKELRDHTGWSLKAAKEYVEDLEHRNPHEGDGGGLEAPNNLWNKSAGEILDWLDPAGRERVLASIRENQKIEAIKELRALTGFGLKESKETVEEIERLGLHR